MKEKYKSLIKQYYDLLKLLKEDEREVSEEVIQIIYDEIEDIQILLGKASQIQPKLDANSIGFKT